MSYHALLYHVVLRTYQSRRTLTETYEKDLYLNFYENLRQKDIQVFRIGGMPDHVHLLISIPPAFSISSVVGEIKRNSSVYMKSERHKFPSFTGWSKSFAVFSYGRRDKEKIIRYIMNQKEHHKRISFEDELRNLFEEEGVDSIDDFLKD